MSAQLLRIDSLDIVCAAGYAYAHIRLSGIAESIKHITVTVAPQNHGIDISNVYYGQEPRKSELYPESDREICTPPQH